MNYFLTFYDKFWTIYLNYRSFYETRVTFGATSWNSCVYLDNDVLSIKFF